LYTQATGGVSTALETITTVGDLQATEAICEREWRLVINTVVAGALCAVGLVGNVASYRVLGRDTEIRPVPRLYTEIETTTGPSVFAAVVGAGRQRVPRGLVRQLLAVGPGRLRRPRADEHKLGIGLRTQLPLLD